MMKSSGKYDTGVLNHLTSMTVSYTHLDVYKRQDEILVLNQGKIEERGTHGELIRRNGIYRRIYEIQMSRDDRDMMGQDEKDKKNKKDKMSKEDKMDGGIINGSI